MRATRNEEKVFNHIPQSMRWVDWEDERHNETVPLRLCQLPSGRLRERLLVGEFSGNNTDSETTDVSPFFANYGYHPQIQTDLFSANRAEDGQIQ